MHHIQQPQKECLTADLVVLGTALFMLITLIGSVVGFFLTADNLKHLAH